MPGEGDDYDDLDLGGDYDEGNLDDAPEDNDAGEGDDTGERGDRPHPSDPDHQGGSDGEPSPTRQPSRAQARIEALDREVKAAKDAAAEAQRQLREFASTTTRASTEAQERERLAQMLPEERAEYLARQSVNEVQRIGQQLQQQLADQTDRAEFAAKCVAHPALARVKDQVEATLVEYRKSGQTLPREVVAAYLIGQSVLSRAPKAATTQRKTAAARVARETARPTTGGSDVRGSQTKDDRAARLERLSGASI